jgi:hypothetical protein
MAEFTSPQATTTRLWPLEKRVGGLLDADDFDGFVEGAPYLRRLPPYVSRCGAMVEDPTYSIARQNHELGYNCAI